MNYHNTYRHTQATILSFLMLAIIVGANNVSADDRLPTYYPATYQETGVIGAIEGNNSLIVGGSPYTLSPNVMIHTSLTQFGSRNSLSAEKKVGFSYIKNAQNRRTITEIWVLPQDTFLQD